jgi:hypothetical protein
MRAFPARKATLSTQSLSHLRRRFSLCDLREFCAMPSPQCVFPARKATLSTQSLSSTYIGSPSVTSVTSVRCLHPNCMFPDRKATLSTQSLSRPQHPFPLCDLRDLCAMLSPNRAFPAQKPPCPPKAFCPIQSRASVSRSIWSRTFSGATCLFSSEISALAPSLIPSRSAIRQRS